MPECHRCGRMQATAELRRTTLRFLCRDNARGTLCFTLTRERREAREVREARANVYVQSEPAQLQLEVAK